MKQADVFQELASATGNDTTPVLSCGDVLRNRERPVALFSPAILFTHGGFDRDPVVEFEAFQPSPSPELRPFCIDLKSSGGPFFNGLGVRPAPGRTVPINWDRRLYAIDQSRAAECFEFLNGIAYSDPKTGLFASTFSYELHIPDPTAGFFSGDRSKWLPVTLFGAIGNTFITYVDYVAGTVLPQAQFVRTSNPLAALRQRSSGRVLSSFTGEDPLLLRESHG